MRTKMLWRCFALALALLTPAAGAAAEAKWSSGTIKPGRVALPVTVHVGGRPVQATFSGVASKSAELAGTTVIEQPRIVAGGKTYYVSQRALRSLFRDYTAPNSGQTIVWGELTRHPRFSALPAIRPAMIDVEQGRLAPAKKQAGVIETRYFNGPWGYIGRRAGGQDYIGLGGPEY